MKLAFVVGGSYKAFYFNHIKECKNVDILVFQENILYEFDYYNEKFGSRTITKEMLSLARKLNCVIFAKIKTNLFGSLKDEILFCDGKKVVTFNDDRYIRLFIKEKSVIFSLKDNFSVSANIFIKLAKKRMEINKIVKNCNAEIFLCDRYGVEYVKRGKIKRKFRKFCYFSLNF